MNNLFAQYYDYNYNYDAGTSTVGSDAMSAGLIFFFLTFTLVFIVLAYVVYSYLLSRIFKKAGVEAWKAWVPVYSSWVTLELGGQKGFWIIFAFIPFVNIVAAVFLYIAMYQIGLKLGKTGVFVLWAIFIPIVWYAWLAFDGSKWKGANAKKVAPAQKPEAPAAA